MIRHKPEKIDCAYTDTVVHLGQCGRPGVAGGYVEEGQKSPVEDGEIVRCHVAEEHHPHHSSCSPASESELFRRR